MCSSDLYMQGPSAPTNLIHHHAVDLNVPIACAGLAVMPGDPDLAVRALSLGGLRAILPMHLPAALRCVYGTILSLLRSVRSLIPSMRAAFVRWPPVAWSAHRPTSLSR